jgi:ribosome-binding factor A
MADPARARRLAKRIAQIVAGAIEHEIKDPRLGNVTITDARITADLRDATVYYTVLGERLDAVPDHAGAAAALESARGVLRSKVGQGTGVRYTPSLTFVADRMPEDARRIDELLAKAREADAEVARRATGARHAGEADPYRAPRTGDELDEDELDGDEPDTEESAGDDRETRETP